MADTSKITLGQLKTALTQAKNYTDNEIAGVTGVSKVEPEASDMPKVFFNGDKPTTKDSVYATIEYISKTEHFKGYVDIKCQGTSSMSYPKKNYTIKMFTDETMTVKLKKDFRGWGKQSKFCLKANYIDHSHARNVVSAKLWGQVVKSRSDFDTLPAELRTSPNFGAVDGFPIKVYYNNSYEGVYTWNIPKDGWMNNMDNKLDTHCILCGEEYVSGCFRSANASLWSDELHDAMPANIVTSFNNFQNFVINSSDDEFKTGLSTYADVNSLIDYYIFQYVICGLDSMGKNQLFFTYDGTKWMASSYDMDSTFGMYWNGRNFVSAEYRMQEDYESGKNTSSNYNGEGNLLYVRLEQIFINEIKARYAELRAGVLSYSNIVNEFERFMDTIGKDLYAEDLTIYREIPSGSTNNIQQIRNNTRDRLTYVDTQIEALRELIHCTGIVLSADTLSFTTTDTQTLSVVVSPDNCTDTITWSVSPTGIITIDNGVVTPIANGACTITATCGNYTDTCSATVSLPAVECTNITLDKDTLALGVFSETIDDSGVNYLDGVEWKNGRINNSGEIVNGNDKCAEINVTLPGKYVFATTSNYKALIVAAILKDNINYISNYTGLNPQIINIYEPCTIRCSVYPNSLDFDSSTISMTRQDFSSYSSKDVTFELSESDIHVKYSNSAYSLLEVYFNNIYDIVAFNFNNVSYKCICRKSTISTSDGGINELNALLTKNLVYNGQYSGKSYINIVLPISMGTTASEILANLNSTTVTINPTSLINELDSSASQVEKLSDTITATVTPENCTQPVVWSVSPQGIVTVDNGLVTAVTNGEATVTATCGTQSATCNVAVSGMSGGDTPSGGTPANLVFRIDSTSMNTSDNTLTDNIAGISATLTGNPTVNSNQIVFTASDSFSFDISSLNLISSNRTVRIKFTPTTLDSSNRNVIIIGNNASSWDNTTSGYISNTKLILQHARCNFTNNTIGSSLDNYNGNRLSTAPVTGQEYELVISANIDGNVRWFVDGTLVQDGTTVLSNPLYISNIEGSSRFIGSYSLIEVYNEYCNDYTEFTNMANN